MHLLTESEKLMRYKDTKHHTAVGKKKNHTHKTSHRQEEEAGEEEKKVGLGFDFGEFVCMSQI